METTIKTNFGIGQNVWFLEHGELWDFCTEAKVVSMCIDIYTPNNDENEQPCSRVVYGVKHFNGEEWQITKLCEDVLFASQEELLEYLRGNTTPYDPKQWK